MPTPAATLPDRPPWHACAVGEVEALLRTGEHGLDPAEAAARHLLHGPNELEEEPPPSRLRTFVSQFANPLIVILLVTSAITSLLGEWVDTVVIMAVLLLNAAIGFVQERHAEASVRALRTLVAPHARVVRAGHELQIPSREVVLGDVVVLESGVRVPADVRLSRTVGLHVDESLLTGESAAVPKHTDPVGRGRGLGDRADMAFAGTLTASGRGRGYAVAIGADSQLGAIAARMRREASPPSPLQRRLARLSRLIGVVAAVAAALTFVLGVALGNEPRDMFRFSVAMAVSAIPEGLPVVVTITLAVGVRRMARRRAIIRRLAAVETLGSTTVIGSDKTGTLTENRMTVQEVWAGGRSYDMSGAGDDGEGLRRTLRAGVLASEAQLYREDGEIRTEGDPTEAALLVAATRAGIEPEQVRDRHPAVAEVPFEPALRYAATLCGAGHEHLLVVKGAPERIAELCDRRLGPGGEEPLDPADVHAMARRMASAGLRVLAFAERPVTGPVSVGPEALVEAGGLVLLGLQGLLDPPRPGVAEAIEGCRHAGIRTVMITGDHAVTARSIALRLGIVATPDAAVLTGADIDDLDDHALVEAARPVSVFARVSPEHKLRIVQALRAADEVVAVTGDGVNDAPALRAADIGIAMGRGGTDVAREAADMVLADDEFTSIHAAVHEGRVTFDNIRKVTFFLLSTGAAEIVALVTALALDWPLLLLPTQILWLNLVTNGVQDVALSFEPAEPDLLDRPPRPVHEGVMSRLLWVRTLVVGAVMAAGTLLAFRWQLELTGSVEQARTAALTTMVLFQAFHLGNVRAERVSAFRLDPRANPFLLVAAVAALVVHAAALSLPPMQFLLDVEPLDLAAWLRSVTIALTVVVAGEAHKWVARPR